MEQQSSPQEQLGRMITGYWISAAVYVAAKLGIADLLKDGPVPVETLAKKTGMHAPSLYRLLRALASVGIFEEQDQQRFQLTPLAELLRDNVPGSQRAFAIMICEECYHAFGDLMSSVRTGKPSFDKLFGKPIFSYLQDHPDKAATFDAAMVGIHGRETAAMLDGYDFSGIRNLTDVGGGNGSLMCEVLRRHPHLRGTVFDLPGPVERAKHSIETAGLNSRCTTIGGSFFESVPGGGDAYLLRHIIHDWDDDKAIAILRNVRKAMSDRGGKLLLVESVIPSGNDPAFGKLLDLTMLIGPGGKERTEQEFRQLYEASGFRLTRIIPTASDVSVIEGEPAKV
jgi:hypothetical protein